MKKLIIILFLLVSSCAQTLNVPVDSLLGISYPFKEYKTSLSYHYQLMSMDLFPFFVLKIPRPVYWHEEFYKTGSYLWQRDGLSYLLTLPVKSYWQSNPKYVPSSVTYTILFYRMLNDTLYKQMPDNISVIFDLKDRKTGTYSPRVK